MEALQKELERKKAQLASGGGPKVWQRAVLPAASLPPALPPSAAPLAAVPAAPAAAPLSTASELTAALRRAHQPARLFGESEADRRARLEHFAGGSGGGGGGSVGAAPALSEPPAPPPSRKRGREGEADAQTSGDASKPAEVEAGGAAGDAGEAGGGAAAEDGGAEEAGAEAAAAAASSDAAPPRAPPPQRRYATHLDAVPFAPSEPGGGDLHKYLYKFWHGLLCEWEAVLKRRPEAAAGSAMGREETRTAEQTREHMTPFFALCKKRALPADMQPLCVEIVDSLLARSYMEAGDAYLRLSIGKAPWLVGVSQVGLHERAAREKIYIGKLPHIMNDETQRRYITCFKRLMSLLQSWRPADPSKQYKP